MKFVESCYRKIVTSYPGVTGGDGVTEQQQHRSLPTCNMLDQNLVGEENRRVCDDESISALVDSVIETRTVTLISSSRLYT